MIQTDIDSTWNGLNVNYNQAKDADTYVKLDPKSVIPSSPANPASPTLPNLVETVITVHYQAENGNMIADDVALKGKVGENYATSQK